MHEPQPTKAFLVPAEDYASVVSRLDQSTLRHAYIGRWATREDFGLYLLADHGARERLATLPRWLRPFVRLDGDAFVADLEATGIYVVTEAETGIHVFDAAAVRRRD